MRWHHETVSALAVRRKGDARGLVVVVAEARGTYSVVAIESEVAEDGEISPEERMARMFSAHAHGYVGTRKDFRGALKMAEDYARAWRAGASVAPPCDCEEIA